ncbi:MAG TPA: NAD(P)/FAD-dependent oxidoreductase [Anaerolineaceae bacterium]
MNEAQAKKVIIIGAGIAGLSAGIYAQMNGYQSKIFELHSQPGGLMTAWKRKGYTIDGCIHWLTGSKPGSQLYPLWQEIGLIQQRTLIDPEIFSRVEGKDGQVLNLYTDIAKFEQNLLEIAPEDKKTIREICKAMRVFSRYDMQTGKGLLVRLRNALTALVTMPYFVKWGPKTMKDLGASFTNPFLKRVFSELWYGEMSSLGLLMTMGWLANHAAGYPLGGSMPMALAVEQRYLSLGGQIRYKSRVKKILVEGGKAAGVRLEDGSEERADVVISAADGHATLFEMLEGVAIPETLTAMYQSAPIFPPLVFVGLGVDQTFDDLPAMTGGIAIELEQPIDVVGQPVDRLDVMVYNFDPSLAPRGKTALNVMINTSYQPWKELAEERERYDAEKEKIALAVIQRLDRRFPGLAGKVEMADVATPLTFERYTGNWQGSFEGWLPTPKAMMKPLPKTIPGLDAFYMVGQWVQPGGGLPSGVMTGREVVQMLCKRDGRAFRTSQG